MNFNERRRAWRSAVGLTPALALLLAGCASVETPSLPAPDAIASTPRFQPGFSARDASLTPQSTPAAWWQLFQDDTLSALERQAAEGNLDLRLALSRIDESRAQLGLAESKEQPSLGAYGGYTRSAISRNSPLHNIGASDVSFNTWQIGLQASWEIDLWGYVQHQVDSSQAQLEAREWGAEAARVSVAAEVARTYLLLRGVQAQVRLTEDSLAVSRELLALTQSRERNGVATHQDTATARAQLAGIEARLPPLQHQRQQLMNALALLLGKTPGEMDTQLSTRAEIGPTMPRQLPVGLPSELARHRPDIQQAEALLRSATADVGTAHADFYPRITLNAALGTQAFDINDLGQWASRQYSMGPTLYLPIFQGGRLERTLALTEARQRSAGLAYQQTVLKAWHEVDDALDAYSHAVDRHAQLDLATQQQAQALDATEHNQREGSADQVAVLQARAQWLVSRATLTEGTTAAALSVVGLYRALGGGWSEKDLVPDTAAASAARASAAAGTATSFAVSRP